MAGLLLSRKVEAGCNEDIVVYCFLNNHKPQVIISQSQADMGNSTVEVHLLTLF